MKKIILILLVFASISMQAQTANGTETKQNAFRSLNPQTVTSANFLTTMGTDGTMGKITPENLPVSTLTQISIDGKVSDTIRDGITTIAPSENAVFDALNVARAGTVSRGLISGDSTLSLFSPFSSVGSFLITAADTSVGNTVNDISVPGHGIDEQKTAWLAVSDKGSYDWIIVQVGLNNLSNSETAIQTIARLQAYVDAINSYRGVSSRLFISKMIPCKKRLYVLYGDTNGLIAYNKWLAINEAIMGYGSNPITGVDGRIGNHEAVMNDGLGNLAAAYSSSDFIHQNNNGREVIASVYRNALNDVGFLKVKKGKILDNYLFNGFKSSDIFTMPNLSAGIGFNVTKIDNSFKFIDNGYGFLLNSGVDGTLRFSVSGDNALGFGVSPSFSDKLIISNTGINISGTTDTALAASHYFVETSSDGFIRPKTLANVKTEIVTSQSIFDAAVVAGSGTNSVLKYTGLTSTSGTFDSGTTVPTALNRLNLSSRLYVSALNVSSSSTGVLSGVTPPTYFLVMENANADVKPRNLINVQNDIVTTASVDTAKPNIATTNNIRTVNGNSLIGTTDLAITKSGIGLGNVDNTSDINKPISTAQQTALDLKANLASPTFTGTPTAPTATAGTNTTQIATTAFVFANSLALSGSQTLTGRKVFNSDNTTAGGIEVNNSKTTGSAAAYAININNTGTRGVSIEHGSSGIGAYVGNTSSGTGIHVSNLSTGTGLILQSVSGTADLMTAAASAFKIDYLGATTVNVLKSNGVIRLKNYTVATLPAGTQGDTAFVTDATAPTYLGTLTGGGSVVCPVFYNGSAWVAH